MTRQHLADLGDQVSLADRKLRLGLLLEVILAVAFRGGGAFRAGDQVADDDLFGLALVRALDDGAGRVPLVGVFQLLDRKSVV